MNANIQVDPSIMRRVRFIHTFRSLARPIFIEAVVFSGTALFIVFSVSIPDVVSNFYHLGSLVHYYLYFTDSFLKTEFIVQATLVLVAVSSVLLVKDSVKNFRSGRVVELA